VVVWVVMDGNWEILEVRALGPFDFAVHHRQGGKKGIGLAVAMMKKSKIQPEYLVRFMGIPVLFYFYKI